jgi:hypothetical protein
MKNHRPQSVFHWQALFIAAPVVIMSIIALYSLRQDKASVLQNARSDADSIAPVLARNCAEAIAKGWIDSQVAHGRFCPFGCSGGGFGACQRVEGLSAAGESGGNDIEFCIERFT